jgi:bifunctional non-homologous end joining protein LigD
MQGVLASWAIPKGPSLNPKDKRLAIRVADHPLSYGSFEGVIPEDHYGAGAVYIWDTGAYDLINGSLQNGRIEFVLHGRKLQGAFVLIKMKGKEKEWLFIKKRDHFADFSFVLKTNCSTTGD